MARFFFAGGMIVAVAGLASAAQVVNYGWEDGVGTVLGMYGSGSPFPLVAVNTAAPFPVHSGLRSLWLEDMSPAGTPQAYLAWVTGLSDGDVVGASFWRHDTTPGSPGAPSSRIWAHWNDDPNDINGFNGSAGGNTDYGPGTGWDLTSHSWTVADGHTGIVIEARVYSNPGDTVNIDDLTIRAPDTATIVAVPEPATLSLLAMGAFAMIRRKRH
ncbi:hypothetical protein LCGC14_2279700 [marine sediment metagenome]|uniref:Ice-binding protein C-terminal domain-containing protein n=1 Tax=marine sediment metagenome TaxID=412755 RepID=A0A0F9CUE5_9ZZZZ